MQLLTNLSKKIKKGLIALFLAFAFINPALASYSYTQLDNGNYLLELIGTDPVYYSMIINQGSFANSTTFYYYLAVNTGTTPAQCGTVYQIFRSEYENWTQPYWALDIAQGNGYICPDPVYVYTMNNYDLYKYSIDISTSNGGTLSQFDNINYQYHIKAFNNGDNRLLMQDKNAFTEFYINVYSNIANHFSPFIGFADIEVPPFEFECSITNPIGCLAYLFFPSKDKFDQLASIGDMIKNKPPFGYFFALKDLITSLTFTETDTPFQFPYIRDTLKVMLWLLVIFSLYKRVTNFTI